MIEAGKQFWNADKTAGYEFVRPYSKTEVLSEYHVKPLGEAERPYRHAVIPEWFWDQVKSVTGQ